MVRIFQTIKLGLDLVFSGIFCTNGEQAARRRLEGWDMVIQSPIVSILCTHKSIDQRDY
jgi:hypothetical protein